MKTAEKEKFLQNVTVICDTREQRNEHILSALDIYHVKHHIQKLDFADYSFMIYGKSFELSCCIERKSSADELWKNITADRERFEKEICCIHRITGQPIILLENISDIAELKQYRISDEQMKRQSRKVQDTGARISDTLSSWAAGNRYNLRTVFSKDPNRSAAVLLEIFYWHWHNYCDMCRPLPNMQKKAMTTFAPVQGNNK